MFDLPKIENEADQALVAKMIMPKQRRDLKHMFDEIDIDGGGNLDADEIAQLFQALGVDDISHEEVVNIIKSADVDGDGLLNFDEILIMYAKNLQASKNLEEAEDAPGLALDPSQTTESMSMQLPAIMKLPKAQLQKLLKLDEAARATTRRKFWKCIVYDQTIPERCSRKPKKEVTFEIRFGHDASVNDVLHQVDRHPKFRSPRQQPFKGYLFELRYQGRLLQPGQDMQKYVNSCQRQGMPKPYIGIIWALRIGISKIIEPKSVWKIKRTRKLKEPERLRVIQKVRRQTYTMPKLLVRFSKKQKPQKPQKPSGSTPSLTERLRGYFRLKTEQDGLKEKKYLAMKVRSPGKDRKNIFASQLMRSRTGNSRTKGSRSRNNRRNHRRRVKR